MKRLLPLAVLLCAWAGRAEAQEGFGQGLGGRPGELRLDRSSEPSDKPETPADDDEAAPTIAAIEVGGVERVDRATVQNQIRVKAGDRLGIIGRNGAGKSTLLKILSRIVEPTRGRISIHGRVASLLEVGTGFHPELTGRENIYLNGAILGMSRAEIRRKFDEIVDFAEVEKFLDTPVKRYSSGMYVRLAFAVAAHLEPEILIVDEVLAVGDAQFQKKCLGKMESVSGEGRTVLFVSHNMEAIHRLCNHLLVLDSGRLGFFGDSISDGIQAYSGPQTMSERLYWENQGKEFDNPYFRPMKFFLAGPDGIPLRRRGLRNDEPVYVTIEGTCDSWNEGLTIGYQMAESDGRILYWSYQSDDPSSQVNSCKLASGTVSIRSLLPRRLLNEGNYSIELIGGLHFREWLFEPGRSVRLEFSVQGGLSDSPFWLVRRPGSLAPVISWEAR